MKSIKNAILQETENWVAINKEAGVLSIPDREQSATSLKEMLQAAYGNIFTVHRLDRETSGVILFAKNEASHQYLSKQFEERSTEKKYNGLVLGKVYEEEGTIDVPIGQHPGKPGQMTVLRKGKPSVTLFKTLNSYNLYSWMEFTILTGRTHQIRVHMQHLGHPIVCDPYYGDGKPFLLSAIKKKFRLGKDELEERPLLNRLGLHAASLKFTDSNGQEVELHAPLPKDLRACLQQLEKQG